MKEFARPLYNSHAWHLARTAYAKSRGGLCERCLEQGLFVPGEIVHHKIHLTPANINDERVTLDWNNLELLCRECHHFMHKDEYNRHKRKVGIKGRYYIDNNGKVVIDSPPSTKSGA